MSWFTKLFGSGTPGSPETEPSELYEGYAITPAPAQAPGGWRVGATIEKDGRRHDLIRADVLSDREGAASASVAKAKQTIDQMGDRLFDGG
jgi:hypothetical protein